ncbi:MAG: hypothetical protein IPK79_00595 [Vampirovibrionales bacterium]|nr:hypothetical protein [Vampirovibrionales bacterium]
MTTSHECWSGSYGAFRRWRNALAAAAGYQIGLYEDGNPIPVLDWDSLPDGVLAGEWPATPDDPLLVLLAHSDCEGWIRSAQAAPLADRLAELIEKLPPDTADAIWRRRTEEFVAGLRKAAEAGEDVEFF